MPRFDDPWIGHAVNRPEIGAPLLIEQPGSPDFRVTSPVTFVLTRSDGLLLHTVKGRYVVGIASGVYIVGPSDGDAIVRAVLDDSVDTSEFVRDITEVSP
jgi:hypothetical protein